MKKRALPLSVLLAGLLAAACSGALARPPAEADDIVEMKARILELQQKAAVTQVELERLRRQVASLEAELSRGGAAPGAARPPTAARPPAGEGSRESATAPRPAVPSPSAGVAERGSSPADREPAPEPAPPRPAATLADEVGAGEPPQERPTGQRVAGASGSGGAIEESELDDEEVALVPVPPREELRVRPEPPTVEAPGTPAPAPPSGAGPPGGERVEAGSGTPVPAAGQALYDRGYTLYHQGRYLDAEATFQRFLQGHAGTELADNAQYWIGECRYARGDLRGALAAFREAVERFPGGNKAVDALLKAGITLEGLGDLGSARVTYEEVIRRFPDSAAAVVAGERLAALP